MKYLMPSYAPSRVHPLISKIVSTKYGIVAVTQTACKTNKMCVKAMNIKHNAAFLLRTYMIHNIVTLNLKFCKKIRQRQNATNYWFNIVGQRLRTQCHMFS